MIAPETEDQLSAPRRRTAVLIPCYNEELTIGNVVTDFRRELPDAAIYVYDNNSADQTIARAQEAGATVRREPRQGKGYVMQAMFREIDADIYVLVDGDATYPAKAVHHLIAPVAAREADMVVGARLHGESEFKALNRAGNRLFLRVLNFIFQEKLQDILSGYRVFSRRFVKSLPLVGGGFEVETELTIKALERRERIIEIPINLVGRPEGSHSKIRLFRDGFGILFTILALFRDYKPLTFFGGLGAISVAVGLIPGTIVIIEFWETGLVPRLPSALLAVGFVLVGFLLLTVGLILHTTVRRFQEADLQMRTLVDRFHDR
jgi:glycosyltransferase involved in cell wall biosynthesis